MKRLGIISAQIAPPWGAGEELWAATARLALQAGWQVNVCVTTQARSAEKVQALAAAGARLCYREGEPQRRPGFARQAVQLAARKLTGPPREADLAVLWAARFKEPLDVVLVSQGGAVCGLWLPGLIPWLNGLACPYVLLCQSDRGLEALSHELRERLARYQARAAHLCFPSQGNLRAVAHLLAWAHPRSRVIQNPVGFLPDAPVPWPAGAKATLASVGRMVVADKGQDVLLASLAGGAWREREFVVNLYGGGPDEGYLRKLAKFYEVESRLAWRGITTNTLPIWQENQLVLVPSRSEGLPLVLLEAMAAGRPVVATRVGGNEDWVEDGVTGFLAEAPTPPCFAAALARAWERRRDWHDMGLAARARFLAHYDVNPAQSMLNLLEQTADAACGPGGKAAVLPLGAGRRMKVS